MATLTLQLAYFAKMEVSSRVKMTANSPFFVHFVHFYPHNTPASISPSSKLFEFVLNFPVFYLISLRKYV